MRVVITGANGMLGHDVVRVAEDMRHQVIALGHEDLDVTDPARVERLITRERPGAVINCAAWTNVDGAEESGRPRRVVRHEGHRLERRDRAAHPVVVPELEIRGERLVGMAFGCITLAEVEQQTGGVVQDVAGDPRTAVLEQRQRLIQMTTCGLVIAQRVLDAGERHDRQRRDGACPRAGLVSVGRERGIG